MIICICGKSGSGKSTLALEIKRMYGEKVIHLNIDKFGHKALTDYKVKNELINTFGKNILNGDNVNRKKLGEIVFNSRYEMNKLTDITWNYMEYEIDKIISENNNKIVVLDWILLPKTKYFKLSNIKILLNIDYDTRRQRCIKRDNISVEQFDLREKASIDYNEEDFDYVLKSSQEIKKVKLYE